MFEIIRKESKYDELKRVTTEIYEFDDGTMYRYEYEYYKNNKLPAKETLYKNDELNRIIHFDEDDRIVFWQGSGDRYTIFTYDDNYYKNKPSHEFTYENGKLVKEVHYGEEIKVA